MSDPTILDVATRLGARLKRVTVSEHEGPCPLCGGRDRFSVNVKLEVFNCRGCGVGGDDVTLVRHVLGCGFREALEFVGDQRAREAVQFAPPSRGELPKKPAQVAPVCGDAGRIGDAVALFRESTDPRGSLAERYLASRKLKIGDLADRVIRWNPRIGAMVTLFRNIGSGEPQAVSRTFLDASAQKLGRKFLGPVGGAAMMLDGFDVVSQGLHVAEGLETAQSARQLGLKPVWALGSAGAISSFPVLGGVECLTLLAENDPASEKAVHACGERWYASGRIVLVNRPLHGNDLNDAVRRVA